MLPYKGTRQPPQPIAILGRNRTGKTVTNGRETVRFDKHGFAEFETKFETLIDDVHIGSSSHRMHYRRDVHLGRRIPIDFRMEEFK
ncbi:hypothetical protein CYFUS_001592 [Cystobacter fuscus]|uniref:Uncharacterized protein n=1 Tax=Cystobacter fuscus TaxID=43 RepID=A0A250IY59_9BACT|nr:hypothetical protein [Cystobacter fuscus]ATB36178.1 hypothetical protein CYFUS_001592 [Cystobacter fuscus]